MLYDHDFDFFFMYFLSSPPDCKIQTKKHISTQIPLNSKVSTKKIVRTIQNF